VTAVFPNYKHQLRTQITVTLVHGTRFFRDWTGGPKWLLPQATLRAELARALPVRAFAVLNWSGSNTVAARMTAGDELKHQLHGLFRRYPDALHFVIAHSHGGAIALRAAQDPAVGGRLAGVFCLASPMIAAGERVVSHSALQYAVVTGLAVYAYCCCAWFVGLRVSCLYTSALAMLVGFAMMRLSRTRIDAHVDRLSAASFGTEQPCPVFFVRSSADEATALLAFMQFIGWVSSQAWVIQNALLKAAMERLRGRRTAISVLRGMAILLAVGVTLAVTSVPVLVMLAVTTAFFGSDVALAGLRVNVSVEATPPGMWHVWNVEHDETPGLVHSRVYEDPRVIKILLANIDDLRSSAPYCYKARSELIEVAAAERRRRNPPRGEFVFRLHSPDHVRIEGFLASTGQEWELVVFSDGDEIARQAFSRREEAEAFAAQLCSDYGCEDITADRPFTE
jgi:hypothetical protein